MLERIWSGWRSSYVGNAPARVDPDAADGSVFTRLLRSGAPDDETHIVHRGREVFAVLNIHPYTTGHLLVIPYREVADLADLTTSETNELWATTGDAVSAVRATYRPDGLNVGLNLGRPAGGSVADPSPRARGASMDRGQQFHVGHRQHPDVARVAGGERPTPPARVADARGGLVG